MRVLFTDSTHTHDHHHGGVKEPSTGGEGGREGWIPSTFENYRGLDAHDGKKK